MKTYEGVRMPNQSETRIVIRDNGKTIAVTAPFRTWKEAEQWEQEQKENECRS